jgi:hypothetical protein
VTLKRSLLLAVLALGLVALLALALRSERVLTAGLPLRIVAKTQDEARTLASLGAVAVLGTGSMAPYIAAAPAGTDPLATVMAYVVTVQGATIADVRAGSLCIYIPEWAGRHVMHQAASFSEGGWIMTGLGTKTYENAERMTGRNFVGIVSRTYIWR